MKKSMSLSSFAIMVIFIQSCTLIPCESYADLETVEEKPKDSELTGTFLPDSRTKESIPGFYSNSELILKKDHTFTIRNFPKSVFNFDAFYDTLNPKTKAFGEWESYYSDYTADLSVSVDYDKANENGKFDLGTNWKIYMHNGKYVICIPVGDPDACGVVRLVKK